MMNSLTRKAAREILTPVIGDDIHHTPTPVQLRRQGLRRKNMPAGTARRQHNATAGRFHGMLPRLGRRRVRARTMPMARARANMEEPP